MQARLFNALFWRVLDYSRTQSIYLSAALSGRKESGSLGGFNIENRENGFADIENLRPTFNVPEGAFNTFNVYFQPRTA